MKGSRTERWNSGQNVGRRGVDSAERLVRERRLGWGSPLTPPAGVSSRWSSPRQLAETAICTCLPTPPQGWKWEGAGQSPGPTQASPPKITLGVGWQSHPMLCHHEMNLENNSSIIQGSSAPTFAASGHLLLSGADSWGLSWDPKVQPIHVKRGKLRPRGNHGLPQEHRAC